ncbi:eps operon transcriptional regulator EpsIIA [Lactobacillus delbrueckii subsp. bulgaricus ATCC 11842 = JCM 1002]|uniref:EpsIIA, Transcriptional regulator of eps operon (LytR family) n=3 Tax=Lactobacillus delbrueckii subsp. bulgaricus TaxID=1585 RepID=Q1G8H9_LACDA|nr:LCP family protein [Lactobacillus delbrueckii]ADY85783.1 Transcription regulator [Lactobacillus delbrueckii subsp. bulgaricus 2038]KRN36651.1 eps operon transcriptional regulator EpsIIA [Lactobacillus delbrueckii subsp. bulgaricus ATCC 11842 = JCM 1002]MDG9749350.1 LCP family protein [Lactobacillus delbrueckii subsp. bulgaricus ATCC 11842 = JCM 1002]QIE62551.1 LytR family transcriptional regulator [Lactobacillus delbrueckii subsp. bulgaricus]CAI98691.1 EpsIIA, Transcriptional regulator of e
MDKNTRVGKRKKRNKAMRIFWSVMAVILVAIGGFALYEYNTVKNAADTAYRSGGLGNAENGSKNSVISNSKPIAILLMGTDTGALGRTYKGRTDSIMVAVLNPKTKKTTLVSFERDQQVNLPDYPENSPSKLNAAYAYGNAKELAKVLKKYYNIPINAYVLINMGGLKTIVNKVGGVDIAPILSFSYEGYTFTKGKTTHMDGAKALAYSRMRYDDPEGDYGRQKRQRQVLSALLNKAESATTLLNSSFISSLSKQVQTDFTFSDMTSMAKRYLAATKDLKTDYTHGTSYMQDGVSYQKISVSERQRISNLIRKTLGLKTKTVSTDSIDTSTSSSSSSSSTTTDSDTTGGAGNTAGPSDNGAAAGNGADSGTTGGYSAGNDQNNSTGY